MVRFALCVAAMWAALAGYALAQDRAATEAQFKLWLSEIVAPKALAGGVSRTTFETAFEGVTLDWDLPGVVFPGAEPAKSGPNRQAEFRAPSRYFNQKNLQSAAAIGRKVAARHAKTLERIEQQTGVPGRIVLAIWARESGFGRVPISHNAFRVLGTRAFASTGEYLTNELVAALKIAEAGHVPVGAMKSSWAGALGQPQFMPASFLAYAVDGDGDGRADIWRSEADTMASIANFLAVHEWVAGRDWGYEVTVPNEVSCALEGPDQGQPIANWVAMGITRVSGLPFPEGELSQTGFLLMPAGRNGPAFLVTPNFFVLKRYNRSDLYALFVGNLADRIEYGMGDFAGSWKPVEKIYRSDIAKIQGALEDAGHDVGGADGLPGYKTRRSAGRWQATNGHPATCFPEPWMVSAFPD